VALNLAEKCASIKLVGSFGSHLLIEDKLWQQQYRP